jgi:hypothetical protein
MDKISDLHEKSRKLDEIAKRISQPTAVELGVLAKIIGELGESR